MRVNVLGPTVVDIDGEWVSVGTPRERAVLTLLALQAGQPVDREEIASLLWDDEPPSTWRKTIQAYVSRLRRSTGFSVSAIGPTYQLDLDANAVDARRFEQLIEGADALSPEVKEATLDEALALWRGRPFAELTTGERAARLATRFDELRLHAQETRFEARLELGRHHSTIAELQMFCAENPLRERARGQLMVALSRSGRQVDALRAFQDYRRHLVEELGVEPSSELVALDRRIAGSEPPADQEPGQEQEQEHGQPARSAAASITTSLSHRSAEHFTGRHDELRQIELWSQNASGLLLIVGEPGIGKTALMNRALAELPGIVLHARCEEGLGDGLGPLARTLEQLDAVDPVTGASSDPEALRTLVPGLRTSARSPGGTSLAAGGHVELTESTMAHRVVAAWVRALGEASQRNRLLIAIDDLHWCGATALAALRQLMRSSSQTVAVVGTVRSIDQGDSRPFGAFEAEVGRDVDVERLELDGLSRHDIQRLSPDGRVLDSGLGDRLHQVSAGHPLFAQALLSELDRSGHLQPGAGGWTSSVSVTDIELPDAVGNMIDRRLRDAAGVLDPCVRIAVLGGEIDLELATDVLTFTEDELVDTLDAAIEAGLVEASGIAYRFRHELIRSGLASRVSQPRRTRIHAAAQRHLLERSDGAAHQRAVRHAREAVDAIGFAALAQVAQAAAEHARQTFVPTDEVEFRQIAVDALVHHEAPTADLVRARTELGEAMVRAGKGERDVAPLRAQVIEQAARLDDPRLMAHASLRIGMDYSVGPAPERIPELAAAHEAMQAYSPASDLASEVQAGYAAQLWAQGNPELRQRLINDALDSTAGRADLTRCRVLASATWALPGVVDIDARGAWAAELVELADGLGLPLEMATGLNALAAARFSAGDLAGGEAAADQLGALRRRTRLPALRLIDVSLQAGIAILHGDLDDAWDMIHDAIEMADDYGVSALGLGPVGRPIIELAADRGAVPRIPPHLFEFGDMLDTYPPYRVSKLYARVFLGDPTAADDIAVEASAIADLPPDIGHQFAANRLAATIDLADADVDDRHVVHVLERYRTAVDWSGSASSGPASLWLGVLRRRRGHTEAALVDLAEAERLADALDAPLWHARILRERALLAQQGGPPAPGAARTARDLSTAAGAHLITHLLDRDGL